MHLISDLPHADWDIAGYATYPGAEWFVEAFDANFVTAWVKARAAPDCLRPVSIDVGFPLEACRQCSHQHADCVDGNICVDDLKHEMALYRAAREMRPEVCEIHFSAGLVLLPDIALQRIHHAISENFELTANANFTARIDSSCREKEALTVLHELGATIAHIGNSGAQDGDFVFAREKVVAARAAGFQSIAVDFPVNGARRPGETLQELVAALISCGPTRVGLRYASDRATLEADPSEMVSESGRRNWHEVSSMLIDAGYRSIATNVFALPVDTHAIAQRQGRLTRQPYGYSAQPVNVLLALGRQTIGYVGALYYQNQRSPQHYSSMLRKGELPIERGLFLTPDDLVRRTIIMSVSTNLFIDIAAIETAFGIDFRRVFGDECEQLKKLEHAGLLTIGPDDISLTAAGVPASNRVCRIFDVRARLLVDKMPKGDLL
ncbi:hypothetical protein LJR034_009191 [Caballeronia sp. LjRoot34]|uniref:hypothetical protein n=1 Tax=Caballeronia sp. LjRoot34 TaxID=3342325 RepID=UPI003ECF2416